METRYVVTIEDLMFAIGFQIVVYFRYYHNYELFFEIYFWRRRLIFEGLDRLLLWLCALEILNE